MISVAPAVRVVAERQIEERLGWTGTASRPVTTVRIWALHDLQFRATVEGHSFISDEPVAGGGQDAAPAPLRYFLAGVAMCHEVFCVKSAALLDLQLDTLESEIAGYVDRPAQDDPPDTAGFVRVTYALTVTSVHTDEQIRTIAHQAARRCPAFTTLAAATPVEMRVTHNGNVIAERTYHGRPAAD